MATTNLVCVSIFTDLSHAARLLSFLLFWSHFFVVFSLHKCSVSRSFLSHIIKPKQSRPSWWFFFLFINPYPLYNLDSYGRSTKLYSSRKVEQSVNSVADNMNCTAQTGTWNKSEIRLTKSHWNKTPKLEIAVHILPLSLFLLQLQGKEIKNAESVVLSRINVPTLQTLTPVVINCTMVPGIRPATMPAIPASREISLFPWYFDIERDLRDVGSRSISRSLCTHSGLNLLLQVRLCRVSLVVVPMGLDRWRHVLVLEGFVSLSGLIKTLTLSLCFWIFLGEER